MCELIATVNYTRKVLMFIASYISIYLKKIIKCFKKYFMPNSDFILIVYF